MKYECEESDFYGNVFSKMIFNFKCSSTNRNANLNSKTISFAKNINKTVYICPCLNDLYIPLCKFCAESCHSHVSLDNMTKVVDKDLNCACEDVNHFSNKMYNLNQKDNLEFSYMSENNQEHSFIKSKQLISCCFYDTLIKNCPENDEQINSIENGLQKFQEAKCCYFSYYKMSFKRFIKEKFIDDISKEIKILIKKYYFLEDTNLDNSNNEIFSKNNIEEKDAVLDNEKKDEMTKNLLRHVKQISKLSNNNHFYSKETELQCLFCLYCLDNCISSKIKDKENCLLINVFYLLKLIDNFMNTEIKSLTKEEIDDIIKLTKDEKKIHNIGNNEELDKNMNKERKNNFHGCDNSYINYEKVLLNYSEEILFDLFATYFFTGYEDMHFILLYDSELFENKEFPKKNNYDKSQFKCCCSNHSILNSDLEVYQTDNKKSIIKFSSMLMNNSIFKSFYKYSYNSIINIPFISSGISSYFKKKINSFKIINDEDKLSYSHYYRETKNANFTYNNTSNLNISNNNKNIEDEDFLQALHVQGNINYNSVYYKTYINDIFLLKHLELFYYFNTGNYYTKFKYPETSKNNTNTENKISFDYKFKNSDNLNLTIDSKHSLNITLINFSSIPAICDFINIDENPHSFNKEFLFKCYLLFMIYKTNISQELLKISSKVGFETFINMNLIQRIIYLHNYKFFFFINVGSKLDLELENQDYSYLNNHKNQNEKIDPDNKNNNNEESLFTKINPQIILSIIKLISTCLHNLLKKLKDYIYRVNVLKNQNKYSTSSKKIRFKSKDILNPEVLEIITYLFKELIKYNFLEKDIVHFYFEFLNELATIDFNFSKYNKNSENNYNNIVSLVSIERIIKSIMYFQYRQNDIATIEDLTTSMKNSAKLTFNQLLDKKNGNKDDDNKNNTKYNFYVSSNNNQEKEPLISDTHDNINNNKKRNGLNSLLLKAHDNKQLLNSNNTLFNLDNDNSHINGIKINPINPDLNENSKIPIDNSISSNKSNSLAFTNMFLNNTIAYIYLSCIKYFENYISTKLLSQTNKREKIFREEVIHKLNKTIDIVNSLLMTKSKFYIKSINNICHINEDIVKEVLNISSIINSENNVNNLILKLLNRNKNDYFINYNELSHSISIEKLNSSLNRFSLIFDKSYLKEIYYFTFNAYNCCSKYDINESKYYFKDFMKDISSLIYLFRKKMNILIYGESNEDGNYLHKLTKNVLDKNINSFIFALKFSNFFYIISKIIRIFANYRNFYFSYNSNTDFVSTFKGLKKRIFKNNSDSYEYLLKNTLITKIKEEEGIFSIEKTMTMILDLLTFTIQNDYEAMAFVNTIRPDYLIITCIRNPYFLTFIKVIISQIYNKKNYYYHSKQFLLNLLQMSENYLSFSKVQTFYSDFKEILNLYYDISKLISELVKVIPLFSIDDISILTITTTILKFYSGIRNENVINRSDDKVRNSNSNIYNEIVCKFLKPKELKVLWNKFNESIMKKNSCNIKSNSKINLRNTHHEKTLKLSNDFTSLNEMPTLTNKSFISIDFFYTTYFCLINEILTCNMNIFSVFSEDIIATLPITIQSISNIYLENNIFELTEHWSHNLSKEFLKLVTRTEIFFNLDFKDLREYFKNMFRMEQHKENNTSSDNPLWNENYSITNIFNIYYRNPYNKIITSRESLNHKIEYLNNIVCFFNEFIDKMKQKIDKSSFKNDKIYIEHYFTELLETVVIKTFFFIYNLLINTINKVTAIELEKFALLGKNLIKVLVKFKSSSIVQNEFYYKYRNSNYKKNWAFMIKPIGLMDSEELDLFANMFETVNYFDLHSVKKLIEKFLLMLFETEEFNFDKDRYTAKTSNNYKNNEENEINKNKNSIKILINQYEKLNSKKNLHYISLNDNNLESNNNASSTESDAKLKRVNNIDYTNNISNFKSTESPNSLFKNENKKPLKNILSGINPNEKDNASHKTIPNNTKSSLFVNSLRKKNIIKALNTYDQEHENLDIIKEIINCSDSKDSKSNLETNVIELREENYNYRTYDRKYSKIYQNLYLTQSDIKDLNKNIADDIIEINNKITNESKNENDSIYSSDFYYKDNQTNLNKFLKEAIINYLHTKETYFGKQLAFFSIINTTALDSEDFIAKSIYKSFISYIFRRLVAVDNKFSTINELCPLPLANFDYINQIIFFLNSKNNTQMINQIITDIILRPKEDNSKNSIRQSINSEQFQKLISYIFIHHVYGPILVQITKDMEIHRNCHKEENLIYFLPYKMLNFLEHLSTNNTTIQISKSRKKKLTQINNINKMREHSKFKSINSYPSYLSNNKNNSVALKNEFSCKNIFELLFSINFTNILSDSPKYQDDCISVKDIKDQKAVLKNFLNSQKDNSVSEDKNTAEIYTKNSKEHHKRKLSLTSHSSQSVRYEDIIKEYKFQYMGVCFRLLSLINQQSIINMNLGVNLNFDTNTLALKIIDSSSINKNTYRNNFKFDSNVFFIKKPIPDISLYSTYTQLNKYIFQTIKISESKFLNQLFVSGIYSKNFYNLSPYYYNNFSFVKFSVEIKEMIYNVEFVNNIKNKILFKDMQKKEENVEINYKSSIVLNRISQLENFFNYQTLHKKHLFFELIENLCLKNNIEIVEIFTGLYPLEELFDYSFLLLKIVILNKYDNIPLPNVNAYDKINNTREYLSELNSYLENSLKIVFTEEIKDNLILLFTQNKLENDIHFNLAVKIIKIINTILTYYNNGYIKNLLNYISSINSLDANKTNINQLEVKFFFNFVSYIIKSCEFVINESLLKNCDNFIDDCNENINSQRNEEKIYKKNTQIFNNASLKKVIFNKSALLQEKSIPSLKEILEKNINETNIDNNSSSIISHSEILDNINNISKDLVFEILFKKNMLKNDNYKKYCDLKSFVEENCQYFNFYIIILMNVILISFYTSENAIYKSSSDIYIDNNNFGFMIFLQKNFVTFNFVLSLIQFCFNLIYIYFFMKYTRVFFEKLNINREKRESINFSRNKKNNSANNNNLILSLSNSNEESNQDFLYSLLDNEQEYEIINIPNMVKDIKYTLGIIKNNTNNKNLKTASNSLNLQEEKISTEKKYIEYQFIVLQLILFPFTREFRKNTIINYFHHQSMLILNYKKYILKGLLHKECFLQTFNLTICFLILINSKFIFLYPIQIFTFITFIPTLKEIAKAFYLKLNNIIAMILFLIIFIHLIAALGFFFLYNNQTSNPNNIIFAKDGEEASTNYCQSILECFIYYFNVGVRSGGGVGDTTIPKYLGDEGFLFKFTLDILFYFAVIIILLNMINGIIISTFAYLRNERDQLDHLLENNCLICFISKQEFERRNLSFEKHKNEEHNIFSYIDFLVNIQLRNKDHLNEIELGILKALEKSSISFYPINKCLAFPNTE